MNKTQQVQSTNCVEKYAKKKSKKLIIGVEMEEKKKDISYKVRFQMDKGFITRMRKKGVLFGPNEQADCSIKTLNPKPTSPRSTAVI